MKENIIYSSSTDQSNTSFGVNALRAASSASFIGIGNTSVGSNTLTNVTTGSFNTIVGADAGSSITNGGYNTIVGYLSAASLSSGYFNSIFGANVAVDPGTNNNIIFADGQGNIKLQYNNNAWTATGSLSVSGHTTFEGVTSTGATGTGNLVYSEAPTITTSLSTTSSSFDLLNSNVTSVNFATHATSISIGALSGTTIVNNNLSVVGTLSFNGISSQLNTTNLTITNPLIYMAINNPADTLDIGLMAAYNQGAGHIHTGLFRKAIDKKWRLASGISTEPDTGISITDATFTIDTLIANLEGNVSGNASTVTTNANLTGDVTSVGNATTLATVTQSSGGSFYKITIDTKGRVTGHAAVTASDISNTLGLITNSMLANSAVANLSGTNTGDETAATIKTKLGITTISGSNTGDQTITLSGAASGSGSSTITVSLDNSSVTGQPLTGYTTSLGAGIITAADTILSSIQKLTGNISTKASLITPSFTGPVTIKNATENEAIRFGSEIITSNSSDWTITSLSNGWTTSDYITFTTNGNSFGTINFKPTTTKWKAGTYLLTFSYKVPVGADLTAGLPVAIVVFNTQTLLYPSVADGVYYTYSTYTINPSRSTSLLLNIYVGTLGYNLVVTNISIKMVLPSLTNNSLLMYDSANNLKSSFTINNSGNIGLGLCANGSNYSGSNNIAIGDNALSSAFCNIGNIAIGYNAAANGILLSNSVAIGYNSLANITNSNENIAIGSYAMGNSGGVATSWTVINGGSGYTTSSSRGLLYYSGSTAATYGIVSIVASGGAVTSVTVTSFGSGFKDTTTIVTISGGGAGTGALLQVNGFANAGFNNVAIGGCAGQLLNGCCNTFIGTNAGTYATCASNTVGIGTSSLNSLTNGFGNIAIGANAGSYITTGGYNLSITNGTTSGPAFSTGNYNVSLGSSPNSCIAGSSSYNIGIGNSTNYSWGSMTCFSVGIGNTVGGSGTFNVAVGSYAIYGGSGTFNTVLGNYISSNHFTGSCNTFLGNCIYTYVGGCGRSGTSNIAIGNNLSLSLMGSSCCGYYTQLTNSIVIGNGLAVDGTGGSNNTTMIGTPCTTITKIYGNSLSLSTGVGACLTTTSLQFTPFCANNSAISAISGIWDSANNGHLSFYTMGGTCTEKFRIGNSGQLGIGGATYGSSGQVLTSSGASAAPTWSYSSVPQNSQSAAYTLALTDSGGHVYHPSADTTARTWTIPANSAVAFPVGTTIVFVNDTSAGSITIAITTDTLLMAGTTNTGSRTLAAGGMATIMKITSTKWIINGAGLT